MGTLYLVATPIGNLEDITLRALRILKEARLIAAEDTRQTRKLLARYEIHTPLLSYHEHNKLVRLDRILSALDDGSVALVSDAGMPGLSDPGYELVRAALGAGHTVSPLPGPSAPVAALVASGLPTDAFIFLGYLPRKTADRRRLLEEVREERRTMLAFEVPHRLRGALREMEDVLGSERPIAVCRELSKVHEEILRATVGEARLEFEKREPRGEFTLVVGGAVGGEAQVRSADTRWKEAEVRRALVRCRRQGLSPTEAASRVAQESGWSKRAVYRMAVEAA